MNSKMLSGILKWFIVYFACILLIQLCSPVIIDTAQYFQSFNTELIFNQISWLVLCLFVGILCILNRILNLKVASIILAVYCTFRFYKGLHPEWSFIECGNVYYFDILVGVLFISGLVTNYIDDIKGWRYKIIKKQKANTNKEEINYSASYSDNSITRKEDDKFGYYEEAELFLDKLEEHRASYQDHALIVGLEGEWGSGKSSFINMVECAISACNNRCSQFKLVKFSSWNYRNSNQLTIELLSMISEAIGVKDITKAIDKYIKVFDGTSFQWLAGLTKVFCGGNKTTQERFADINEKLKNRTQTLIIAVDDIDRLVKEEVLEVLKLVRNTANFSNIVYVVAYDRNYVEGTLKDYGINNSEKYLEKIFNVPFLLPVKGIEQRKELYKDILQKNILFNKTDRTDNGIKNFVDEFVEYISIRNLKKLSKQLLINTPFVKEDGLTFELDIYDTLILYYLNIKYKKIYEELRNYSCDIKKCNVFRKGLIYCNGGYISINIHEENKRNSDIEFYKENKIVPIVGKNDADLVLKLLKGLFGYDNKKYDKTAYSISNSDLYPYFFTKKIPENYVRTKDFIDESKRESFPKKLREWNTSKNRSILKCVIASLVYDDYSEEEFMSMFKTVISEVTIKEFWTIYTTAKPVDKTFTVIPGIDYSWNRKSQNYLNTVKKVIENFEYDGTFSQRFVLLIQSDMYNYIYKKDSIKYIQICKRYLDVYLSQNIKFEYFNNDFWYLPFCLYRTTYDTKIINNLQDKCKTYILNNIRSFADNWNRNINNDFLAGVFCRPQEINEAKFSGGWKEDFFQFIKENENNIDKDIVELFLKDFQNVV